ncbi:MAG: hypothetical protein K0R54_186 [Clostridiaceae bacterium]|jgi:hypothetical protein|nr:hypothetical protein [Clostridiaceae bacterium]
MHDSGGSGLGALAIILGLGSILFSEFVLKNIIWFIIGAIICVVLYFVWIFYIKDYVYKFRQKFQDSLRNFILKKYKVDMYNNRKLWGIYVFVMYVVEMIFGFFIILIVIRCLSFLLGFVD